MTTPQPLTARAEGGTHDGEEFDISPEIVGVLLNSRDDPVTLEYYELVLYMRGNLLRFVRSYDSEERRLAFGVALRHLDVPSHDCDTRSSGAVTPESA